MEPIISVIIPLYNKEKFIKRTIQSVLDQEFSDFEVVVVDDGSSDQSSKVVKSFKDERLRMIWQSNSGVSAARNKGIDEARADIIAFLDADDVWYPCFLNEIMGLYNSFSDAALFSTAYEFGYSDGGEKKAKYHNLPSDDWRGYITSYFSSIQGDPPVWTSAVAIKKNVFMELGGFHLGYQLGEDLDMWARIALNYPIAWSSRICARYNREDSQSLTSIREMPDQFIIFNTLRDVIEGVVTYKSDQKIPDISSALGWYLYVWSRANARKSQFNEARRAGKEAMRYSHGFQKVRLIAWLVLLQLPSFIVLKWVVLVKKK